jgi:NitT/TauT family transport system substrate-binding protein
VQDSQSGIKLLAADAWFVKHKDGTRAFLLKEQAEAWAKSNGGYALDFTQAKAASAS